MSHIHAGSVSATLPLARLAPCSLVLTAITSTFLVTRFDLCEQWLGFTPDRTARCSQQQHTSTFQINLGTYSVRKHDTVPWMSQAWAQRNLALAQGITRRAACTKAAER